MSLLLRTHFDLAKTSLKERRGRTFLTCLGIAIGVASIILILSLMGSINNLIKSQVEAVGGNLIIVRPSDSKGEINDILTELTASNHFNKSNLTLNHRQKAGVAVGADFISVLQENESCKTEPLID